MQTSTPLIRSPQRSLRKSLLLRDVTNTTSPMRRLSNVIQITPIAQSAVDDDLERSSRRNEADIQRRVSNISVSQSPLPTNEKEIRDHFQICLKMYAENKISAKNAWNLKIIDYMRVVLYSKGLAKDSLQVAGTSLDVSTKIYGIRVDDIHSDGLKLASNMARVNPPKESEGGEDGDEEAADGEDKENEGPKRKKKQRRMLAGQKLTVAKDPKSLLGDVLKLESVFFQTRMNLESSSMDNLFTNKLLMHPDGYKIMLLSKERAWATYDNVGANIDFEKEYPFEISKMNVQICEPFANFEIDEWDPENEDHVVPEEKKAMTEEVVYDAEGIPIPELDGSVHDVFANADADNHYASSEEEEVNGAGQVAIQNKTVAHIVDFKPEENGVCADEYSYAGPANIIGNKRITQVWAGPSHWKLKHIRRMVSRFSGQAEKQICKSVKKPRVQPTIIDFSVDVPALDKTKIYKNKRCRIDEDPFKCTLPSVLPTENNQYRSLMLKPVFLRKNVPKNEENAIEGEVQPYNYENPNDSQYCSQNGAVDDDDNGPPDDDDFHNEEEVMLPQQNFMGENLIDAPELVPKTYIPYALQAKKMDMKKLKSAVWKTLVSEASNQIVPDDGMYAKEVRNTTFATMYKELPGRITEKMQQELSCPLAFVALLHLANEQNLEFKAQPDLKDFAIRQVKQFEK